MAALLAAVDDGRDLRGASFRGESRLSQSQSHVRLCLPARERHSDSKLTGLHSRS